MGMFTTVNVGAGWNSGRLMRAALATIWANFGLLEPAVKDSGALDYVPLLNERFITRSRATAQTLTLPTNAAVAIPIGAEITVIQSGAGALTLVAPAGGAINKLATKTLVVAAQWGVVKLRKVSANGWVASGDLTIP